MTCEHKHVERADLEVWRTHYKANPETGDFDIKVFDSEYVEDLWDAPPHYTCMDCFAETEDYDELTGEWG